MQSLMSAVVLIILALAGANDAKVDNPEFKSWADHGVGTTVVLETILSFGDEERKWDVSSTLHEKGAESCAVEVTDKNPGAGAQADVWTRQVLSKTKKGTEYLPDEYDGTSK